MGFNRQVNGNFIQVFIKPNELGHARLGLIISKRIERRAVKRNRIKRIVRENFRLYRVRARIAEMDWVVRLKRPISKLDAANLAIEVHSLMIQLSQCHE
ncbi:MAG: ribonuclease P protein component [Nitrosomonas sp.]|nr:MAG: ribonuclease P protein component [Nitrosomonas sp.]